MSEYGVTSEGFVIKRLDTILSEVHQELSSGFGFRTDINPQSFFNILLTGMCDQIAELWELTQDVYFSQYPSSAQGLSLDHSVQYGGIKRLSEQKTMYQLTCTGKDGTKIPAGTLVASDTNPSVRFVAVGGMIDRSHFNRVRIRVLSTQREATYTIGINGDLYNITTAESMDEEQILTGLCESIANEDYLSEVNNGFLEIKDVNLQRGNTLLLSENLTTETVSSLVNFNSESSGKILLPDGTITSIVTNIDGFRACSNLTPPVFGRLRETDVELRQSYIKRIAARSSYMLESVTSAILDHVQGIESISAYENNSNLTDEEGRPPHSVELVVDGGSDMEIARQILRQKAGGIQTFGDVEVEVPDLYGRTIPIRFNRPAYIYVWMRVTLTLSGQDGLPPNYAELCKQAILEVSREWGAGISVYSQKFYGEIYRRVSGILFVKIGAFSTENAGIIPAGDQYTQDNVLVGRRQKPVIEAKRIEVVLNEPH